MCKHEWFEEWESAPQVWIIATSTHSLALFIYCLFHLRTMSCYISLILLMNIGWSRREVQQAQVHVRAAHSWRGALQVLPCHSGESQTHLGRHLSDLQPLLELRARWGLRFGVAPWTIRVGWLVKVRISARDYIFWIPPLSLILMPLTSLPISHHHPLNMTFKQDLSLACLVCS
jgi:hypothetical protein